MKRSAEPLPNVYLSCATRDLAQADEMARNLTDVGFTVRRVSELDWQQAVAEHREETVWTALRNSLAMVILGTRGHIRSPVLTMEVGSALAGQKAIYVLVEPDAADDLPSYLQRQHLLPLTEPGRLVALLEEGLRGESPLHSPRSRSSR
jgi:TIR domain